MFTLVPSDFFDEASSRQTLSEVAPLSEGDEARHVSVPQYGAELIYGISDGDDSLPEIYSLLQSLPDCTEYNKILASWHDGKLSLAIAQGKSLLLANEFSAPEFTTAEYYLFASIRALQINPEVSTVSWKGAIEQEDEISLYRYFKSVEIICE